MSAASPVPLKAALVSITISSVLRSVPPSTTPLVRVLLRALHHRSPPSSLTQQQTTPSHAQQIGDAAARGARQSLSVAPLDLCLLRSSPLTTPRPVLSLVAAGANARIKDSNDERVAVVNTVTIPVFPPLTVTTTKLRGRCSYIKLEQRRPAEYLLRTHVLGMAHLAAPLHATRGLL